MKTRVDERLRREAAQFRLRYACDHCAHAAGEGISLACSLGYPAAPRSEALAGPHLELCKSFELA